MQATTAFKKAEAFAVVQSMRNGETPSDLDLDRLYLYFAPAAPRNNLSVEQWIAKAVPKNDIRHYLNFIHVKDGVMYGTDGHRLHWGVTDKADGFYCPKTFEPVEFDGKYPDVGRVIESYWGLEGKEQSEINVTATSDKEKDKIIWRYDFRHMTSTGLSGSSVQKHYMDMAIARKVDSKFTVRNDGQGVYGEYSDGAKFIVMGMRV